MVDFVFGLNQSGIAVAQLLIKLKKNFHCWDDNKKLRDVLIKKFPKLKFKKVQKNNINKYNNFFLTPGVSLIDKRFKDIPKHKFKRDLNLVL